MLEQYEGAIIESTTFVTQASDTVQAFYDTASVQIDQIYLNQLNVAWSGEVVGVESEFWLVNTHMEGDFYPIPNTEMQPR